MPPDRGFVLTVLPEHSQILVAVGARHAFKFACLMGKILGELALDDKTSYPIEAFRLDRPALTDPSAIGLLGSGEDPAEPFRAGL